MRYLLRAQQHRSITPLGIMQLREIIAVALSSLRANKLRSGLTMLGIIIGIVFGVWPARRAATLDPIRALRCE